MNGGGGRGPEIQPSLSLEAAPYAPEWQRRDRCLTAFAVSRNSARFFKGAEDLPPVIPVSNQSRRLVAPQRGANRRFDASDMILVPVERRDRFDKIRSRMACKVHRTQSLRSSGASPESPLHTDALALSTAAPGFARRYRQRLCTPSVPVH